jgi:cytochrome bd ubiquinol oxidase subunit II
MMLDLPLIWAGIIALAVLLYVVADGFDLGVGMLFPFARRTEDRDLMMNTIAPYWDGNETWLVLGGGGLFAAFPVAYATLMPALYLPVLLMLIALVLRGVAFEFRARGRRHGRLGWSIGFFAGSLLATIAQGLILGGFIQGVTVRDGAFSGGPFDWLTSYTLLVAVGVVAGYALLGATWLMMRTEDDLHAQARRWAWIAGAATLALLAAVSLATLFLHPRIAARWGFEDGGLALARFMSVSAVPLLGLAGAAVLTFGLARKAHVLPFLGALVIFLSGYLGLAVGFAPYVVPYALTFRDAASEPNALGLMLVGVAILLPLILGYTAYVYWIFRGKVGADAGYH